MKKFIKTSIVFLMAAMCIFLFGCNPNNEQALASDIDISLKNFLRTITNMDWPEEIDIDKLQTLNDQEQTYIVTQIDTEEIDTWKSNLKSKINILLSKRGDLLSASNELVSNNVNLTEELYLSIKVYLDIIKDNSNYLTNYNGIIRNQIHEINELIDANRNINIINAYAIKIVEALSVRCAKVDTTILAMNSIIEIIENNLIDNMYKDKKFVADEDVQNNNNNQPEIELPNNSENINPDIDNDNDIDEDTSENALRIEPDNVKSTNADEKFINGDDFNIEEEIKQ